MSTPGAERTAYAVLALAALVSLVLVGNEMGWSDGAVFIGWNVLAYALAAVVTHWLRGSRWAMLVLLGLWTVLAGVSLWYVLLGTAWSRSDMSGLLLLAVPVVQIPTVLVAALIGWLVRHRELTS